MKASISEPTLMPGSQSVLPAKVRTRPKFETVRISTGASTGTLSEDETSVTFDSCAFDAPRDTERRPGEIICEKIMVVNIAAPSAMPSRPPANIAARAPMTATMIPPVMAKVLTSSLRCRSGFLTEWSGLLGIFPTVDSLNCLSESKIQQMLAFAGRKR